MNTGQIVGPLIGGLGAAIGIYCSIRGTKGPKERALMVRFSVWCCVGVLGFIALFFAVGFALPHPYKPWVHLLWLAFPPALIIAIVTTNKHMARIREEEAQDIAQEQNMAQPDAQDGESADAPPPPVS